MAWESKDLSAEGKLGTIAFVIFSYNRGAHLENLLLSMIANLPRGVPAFVFDDGSDDSETLRVLHWAVTRGFAVLSTEGEISARKPVRGSLYANMQTAFESLDYEILIFVQDDMQVVRQVTRQELENIYQFLALKTASSPFVYLTFLKTSERTHNGRGRWEAVEFVPENPHPWYIVANQNGRVLSFAAVLGIHRPRARQMQWRFGSSENETREIASELFGPMPLWPSPFLAYLPNSPSFRGKTKTLVHRLWEHGRTGLFPFVGLNAKESAEFSSRNFSDFPPFVRDFLTTRGSLRRQKWHFTGGVTEAPRLVRALDKGEKLIRRVFLRK